VRQLSASGCSTRPATTGSLTGQVTDRFTQALERLSSGELYVRLGGVYALEHVMRDSPDHHHDVVDVLTAFIRRRAPQVPRLPPVGPGIYLVTSPPRLLAALPPRPEPDVQVALKALARRPRRPGEEPINLSTCIWPGRTSRASTWPKRTSRALAWSAHGFEAPTWSAQTFQMPTWASPILWMPT
jgi:hypothetical protein